jgi:DNA-directed RNA polymerase II subunit RPB9
MLSPVENMQAAMLVYKCRSCPYAEQSVEAVVYRHDVHFREKEKLQINSDVIHDPTLSRTQNFHCSRCLNNEAVFWQLSEKIVDDRMGMVYVCTGCGDYKLE